MIDGHPANGILSTSSSRPTIAHCDGQRNLQ